MKLYIWVDPYRVSYGSSLVFAVAENLQAARKQAAKGLDCKFGDPTNDPPPKVVLGKPTRVVSLPCAEWHYWAE